MKEDILFKALGDIDESSLEKAENIDLRKAVKSSSMTRVFIGIVAAAAVIAIVFGSGLLDLSKRTVEPGAKASSVKYNTESNEPEPTDQNLFASLLVSDASYPLADPYPGIYDYMDENGKINDMDYSRAVSNWRDRWFSKTVDTESVGSVQSVAEKMTRVLLEDTDSNTVFSPLSVYMALGMLSETAGGSTQAQILDVLDADSTEDIRKTVQWLWDYVYRNDDLTSTVMADSLWLDSSLNYKKETLERLSESYKAQSFYGQMGSQELNEAMQSWLKVNTRGLLDAANFSTDPDYLLTIVSSLYFHSGWNEEFSETDTTTDNFYGASGINKAEFMHKNDKLTYYRGKNFSAVMLALSSMGHVWFVLPDEGASPSEIAQEKEFYDLVSGRKQTPEDGYVEAIVDLSLPKFDASSDTDLNSALQTFGIADAFDPSLSDFSGVLDDCKAVLSARQSTRIVIDEKGITAASVATMDVLQSGTDLKAELNFNRPFLFVINAPSYVPLFAGIVNNIK